MKSLVEKVHAASIHLIGSAVIVSVAVYFIFFVWYPGHLSRAIGVLSVVALLVFVDLAIGPLLTFIVYDRHKKSLRIDLSIIIALQLVAFIYGMHALFIGRPAFEVFVRDRFEVVRAHEVGKDQWQAAQAPFNRAPVFGPLRVAAIGPVDSQRRSEILLSAAGGGADLAQMPEFYVTLAQAKGEIAAKAQPIARLKEYNRDAQQVVDALSSRFATQPIGFLPLKAPARDMAVIVNTSTGEVLDTVDLRPWS